MGVCSPAMAKAVFDSGAGLSCSVDTGYSLYVITAVPTPDEIRKICASSECKRAISVIRGAQPSECNTGGPRWDFKIYEQIINPIEAGCRNGGGTPPATAPPPPPPPPPPTTPPPPPTAPPQTAPPPPPQTAAPPAAPSSPSSPSSPSAPSPGGGGGNAAAPTPPSGGQNNEGPSAPAPGNNGGAPAPGNNGGVPAPGAPVNGNGTPVETNQTSVLTPNTDSISLFRNSTGGGAASTINNKTTESSDKSNMTVIIAIVAGVVVVIAIVAFIAFRAGRRKNSNNNGNRSPRRELSPGYAAVPSTGHYKSLPAVVDRPAPRARFVPSPAPYVQSPVTTATSSSDARSSVVIARPSAPSSNPNASVGSTAMVVSGTAPTGLWTDSAIQKARIPLEEIMVGKSLNNGAFGEVFSGSYNGEQVAIKRLVEGRRKDMHEIETFLEEAKLLAALRHQRIVQFIGVAWDSLSDLCIVTELMEGGDLRTMLNHADINNDPTGFDANKVKIALHTIHALSYLHGLKPPVVHRDLKSKNVLLTRDLDAKLTDFGVSRERVDSTMTSKVGSSLWMAPEVMLGKRYDEKADIFSFGVVLSELDTQKLPYSHAKESGSDRQVSEMAILNMVSTGDVTVAFTEGADEDMVALGQSCVAVDPENRPTASEVLHRMHKIYRDYLHV